MDKAKREANEPNPVQAQAKAKTTFNSSVAPSSTAQAAPSAATVGTQEVNQNDGYPNIQLAAPGVSEKETATPDQLDVNPVQKPQNNPFGSTGEAEKDVDAQAPSTPPKPDDPN